MLTHKITSGLGGLATENASIQKKLTEIKVFEDKYLALRHTG